MESITAIYEGGVFKPVGEVLLPEKTEVRIPLPGPPATEGAESEVAKKQKAALEKLFKELDALPSE